MREYEVALLDKKEIARGTMLFQFAKPKGFEFVAGQFGIWTLPQLSPKAREGNRRYFTIASPPYFDHLEVAMRMRPSPFKKKLQQMRPGEKILFSGPAGNFILPGATGKQGNPDTIPLRRSYGAGKETRRQIVFLCGGIGITPARSMILQAAHEETPHRFFLFYSNNAPEDAAFLDDFSAFVRSQRKPRFLFVPTMTGKNVSKSAWTGERGYIDEKMLKKHLPDIKKPIYYVVGPPGFVTDMEAMLEKAGVEKGSINTERFVGYN